METSYPMLRIIDERRKYNKREESFLGCLSNGTLKLAMWIYIYHNLKRSPSLLIGSHTAHW